LPQCFFIKLEKTMPGCFGNYKSSMVL